MWILYSLLAILAVLVALIMLLPVKIILKNDENNKLLLRYRLLFLTFGNGSQKKAEDSGSPVAKAIGAATGVDRLQIKTVQNNIRSNGLQKTLSDSYGMLTELLREVVSLLKHCRVTRLHIQIRCGGNDADQVAIHYGQCCAATNTLLNTLRNFIKIRDRGCKINIGCNFFGDSDFRYEVILAFPIRRVLMGLGKILLRQAKYTSAQKKSSQKP